MTYREQYDKQLVNGELAEIASSLITESNLAGLLPAGYRATIVEAVSLLQRELERFDQVVDPSDELRRRFEPDVPPPGRLPGDDEDNTRPWNEHNQPG